MGSRGTVEGASQAGNAGPSVTVEAAARNDWRALLSTTDWQRVRAELGLSLRELQVVQHIFAGKKLCAIARDMQLGLGTVKTYCQRIHRKLGVTDQRELTLAVVDAHLRLVNASR